MRLVCLAEAQAATARRAEERGTALRLVAKLHLGAWELFRGRMAAQRSRGGLQPNQPETAGVRVARHRTHRARAYRCAAEEAMAETDVREAIALCDAGMKHPSDAPRRRRNRPGGKARGTRVDGDGKPAAKICHGKRGNSRRFPSGPREICRRGR